MKKSIGILAFLVILAVAYVGASWYVGKRAQTTIEQGVAQANERLTGMLGTDLVGSGAKFSVEDYQRHVFSSDIVYNFQMQGADGAKLEFKLKDHLQHGPFPIDALRSGDFKPLLAVGNAVLVPSVATQKWFDSLKGEPALTVATKVGFSGAGSSDWLFKPLNLSDGQDTLKFSGGTATVIFSNDFKDSTTHGVFESMHVIAASTGEDLLIKGVKLDSKTTASGENQVHLKSGAGIDSVVMTSNDEQSIRVKGMTVGLDSTRTNNLLDGSLRYDFGQVTVGQTNIGSISLGLKGRQVDIGVLAALFSQYDAIAAKNGGADQTPELTNAETVAMREKLMTLLAAEPSVSVDPFVWKNDKGQSVIALNVDLTRPADKNAAEEGLDSLLSQIVKLVNLDISVSRPMFIQALAQAQPGSAGDQSASELAGLLFDQYADKLGKAGLIQIKDDKAVSAIHYENNSVVANGQKMTIPEFVQRALSVAM